MTRFVLRSAQIATMSGEGYGLIENGAVAVDAGRIHWVGPMARLPGDCQGWPVTDAGARVVTPGLIDCHTHLVFGGNRAAEFEQRLNGVSYEQIAREGGGIVSTVSATRAAGEDALVTGAAPRLAQLMAEGVTTVEIKSGYGLDAETELRMLRAARGLAQRHKVEVRTSYLGAHAVPPEYKGRADAYIDEVCIPALHAAADAGLADAVDGFCEGIAFDTAHIARVFDAAASRNLPVKLHAEQLSNMGGAQLAARYGALSADHVEYATGEDARAMAGAGTVAVLLPGAFYTLRETQMPPVDAFRTAGVAMAVATDCNPGSSPMTSLLLAMNMACTCFRLTPREALAGTTVHAARALGLADRGRISAGLRADLAVWDVDSPGELAYRIGFNPLHMRIFGGEIDHA